jgi:hypothetical protein
MIINLLENYGFITKKKVELIENYGYTLEVV